MVKSRRESRVEPPPYQETFLETTPLLPGSDAWTRRRQINRKAKFFGVVLSIAWLIVVGFLVIAAIYKVFPFDREDEPEDGGSPVGGLGRRVVRMTVGIAGR